MRFVVEPRLLDHFGVAMYNTLDKAIAELVANGYDADASEVVISLEDDAITVADNGSGMTPAEVQDGYLHLGRDRRSGAAGLETTGTRKRPVIGHKGIGKLAGLGIAEAMIVATHRARQKTEITIDREELEAADSLEQFDLKSKVSSVPDAKSSGTQIRLQGLLIELDDEDAVNLRQHLALELPSQKEWRIVVNGVEASIADVPGVAYQFDDEIEGFGRVKGFYKTVKRKKGMDAGFAIRIRGRIVQPTTLFTLNQQSHGYFALTKIVGELEPDFIDALDSSDPDRAFDINTSRTGLNPASPRVEALQKYAERKLATIAEGITAQRAKDRKAAAQERNPGLEERMKRLGPEVYAKVDAMLEKVISQLARNESRNTIDELADIIVKYYESDALRALVDSIRDEDDADVERLAELLAQFGAARISDIAQLLHSQLLVIESLRQKVEDGELEAELHSVIVKNIWLLRESLVYWFDNKTFATQLAGELADTLKSQGRKRPDLVCFDDGPLQDGRGPKRLVVVEFKRPGVVVGPLELAQVMAYKSVFQKSLGGYRSEDIDVVILGDTFDPAVDRNALGAGYSVLSYLELLAKAKGRYQDIYDMLVPEGMPVPGVAPRVSESDDEEGDEPLASPPPKAVKRQRR